MEIFIIYSANNSLLSKAIKCYTKEKYNHVSIALDVELKDTYSFGRKKINNPLIGGFVKEDFKDPFFLTSHCSLYSLEVTEEQYESIRKIISYFETNKELFQYNLLGLVALSMEYCIERENAYFCSEFVAMLLTESKIATFQKKNQFITPKDLLALDNLTKVYEGQMIDYLLNTVRYEENNAYASFA
ncbi:hypothetical protein [Vagococcus hydrophili]|uniref:Uncharacterized protein n=1 Tax=Vagococcus hydrophili TaxID=2714947 RepID=A0A6G8AWA2_9ENTE|nr:hypothetical protein [Vagococcus hydrophili]QIL49287.1 hypothetical protein G7082_12695 [Vagococcus hydrophili]